MKNCKEFKKQQQKIQCSYFQYVAFCCDENSIISVNLNKINFDNNFDEDHPDTVILIRFWFGIVN